MKKLLLFFLLATGITVNAQVAINTDGTAPDNSAMLDVKSTTRGLLAPRMTLVQRNAIATPATGLIVFQTNGSPGYYYNSGTPAVPAWTLVGSNAGQWQNNGSNIYYNMGNVGIGTDSPLEKLHVDGDLYLSNTTGINPFVRFNNTVASGNAGLELMESGIGKAWVYYRGDIGSLIINADNLDAGWAPHLVVKNDGNVGIGTLTPAANFHVAKSLPKYTALFGDDIHSYDGATALAIGDNSNTALVYVGQSSLSKGFLLWNYDPTPANAQFWIGSFNGSNPLVLQPVGGKVGVGTTPEALFQVAEESPGYTAVFGTPVSLYTTGTNVSIGDDNATSVLHVGQSTTNKGHVSWQYNPTPANAHFSIGTYSGNNPLVLQEAGGNVGVNVNNPLARLHVGNMPSNYTGLFGDQIGAYTSGSNVSIGDDAATSLLYLGQGYSNKGFLIWNYNATPANANFSIGTYAGNNPLILQDAGGNVGIGTTAPGSRLEVDYNINGRSYLGYSPRYPAYLYHEEELDDGDGQSNLYALRTRPDRNDGTGYSEYTSNTAIKGYSYWGDIYSFGIAGFNYNDYTRCGGVFGGHSNGSYWGSIGYKNSSSITYGGYFTSYTSGTGKSSGQAETGIGLGAWGELMGADIHGKVYGIYAEGENYAMFSNGDVYKNKLDVHLQNNGTSTNTVLYTNVSTDVTVQTCGVAILLNGRANIAFDPSFAASVSAEAPVIVTVTPIGNSNGVYLAEVSASGFAVVENNAGKSNVAVNYIAIGKRVGYEHPNLPQEVIDAGYTSKMARGLHNDADITTNGEGLYYESGQLVVGIHPSTLPDPNKPAIETIIPKPSVPSNEGLGVNGISTGAIDPTQVQQNVPVQQIPGNGSISGRTGEQAQIQPITPVKAGPVAETAATGTGKATRDPQALPGIKNNGNVSPSAVSSPPDRPVQNK